MEANEKSERGAEWQAGWYKHGVNGVRFWDGEQWTDQMAPMPAKGLNSLQVAAAVFAGVLAAWVLVLILAQADPDTFYLPVKFVVEEAQELPDF